MHKHITINKYILTPKSMKIHYLLLKNFGCGLVVFYALLGCQSNVEADLSVLGLDYYPIEVGRFIDYQVEITNYSISEAPNTQTFQLREQIGASFIDVNGEVAYRLERFKRNLPTETWALDSIWSVRGNRFNVVRNENNRLFVTLAFPVSNGLRWDGNTFNVGDTVLFEIKNSGIGITLNEFDFSETLTVLRNNSCSNIDLSYSTEIFAREVGLVRKVSWQISFDNTASTDCVNLSATYCPSLSEALPPSPDPSCVRFGRIYTQTIIDYGIR